MAHFIEPGHIAMVMLTPEQYSRMIQRDQPTNWPMIWAMRNIGHTLQDVAMKFIVKASIVDMAKNMETSLGLGIGLCDVQASAGPEGDEAGLKANILGMYRGLYDFWQVGVLQGVGAAYSSAVEQFTAGGQLLYAYKVLRYHTAITPRMRRHWNARYTPVEPEASMAYVLYKRGIIDLAGFKKYAAWDGWSEENAALLIKAMETIPTPREAFSAWSHGVLDEKARNSLYRAGGYADSWHALLTEIYSTLPTPHEAFYLWMKGLVTLEGRDALYRAGGFSPDWYGPITENWSRLPTPEEAFYLWAKGQIKEADRNALYRAGGYAEKWYGPITENWQYTPTLYDLVRLSDYVELDQIWSTDVMRRRGMKDRDIAKVWPLLKLRPLREEVRALTTKWTTRYRYGRASDDEMATAFTSYGVTTKEQELLLEKAHLDYEDEITDEWVVILRWRFRTAVITEEEFLDGLLELGIRAEKANLIVETEKAMGYYGYY